MIDWNKINKKSAKTASQNEKSNNEQYAKIIEKTKSKAEEYLHNPEKTKRLLEDAVKKSKSYEKNRGPLGEVWSYLTALFRLLRAYIRGDYRDIRWSSIVLVTVGIIYFVSPIDLWPDSLPGGLIDDVAVIGFVIAQIKADLDNFLTWEITQAKN